MTFRAKTGSFSIGTGAAASTVAVTGVGFVPKAILFFWSGRTESTDTYGAADHYRGYGVGVSSASRHVITSFSQNGVSPSSCRKGAREDACLYVINGAGTDLGRADLQSMDADGFTLVISTQFTRNVRIHYQALGGEDLKRVKRGSFQQPVGLGNAAVTGVGFMPDALFIMGTENGGALPTTAASSRLSFGMAARSGGTGAGAQVAWAGGSQDNVATSNSQEYISQGEIIAGLNSTLSGIQSDASLNSWDSDGFTLNWANTAGSGNPTHLYLALQGGKYKYGGFDNPVNGTPASVSGFGFKPVGGVMISGDCPEAAFETPTNDDKWSFGAWDKTITNEAALIWDRDNQATTAVKDAIWFDGAFLDHVNNATTIQEVLQVDSNDVDGFTYHMSTTLSAETNFVGYMAFGSDNNGIFTNIYL